MPSGPARPTKPGVTWTAGQVLRVRLQVTGLSPTTLAARVWDGTEQQLVMAQQTSQMAVMSGMMPDPNAMMILQDASLPRSTPAHDWTPRGVCKVP